MTVRMQAASAVPTLLQARLSRSTGPQVSRCSSTSSLCSTLAAHTNFFDPAAYEIRRRSAQLTADPKARELANFVGSRNHEMRLRDAAGLGEEDPITVAHCAKRMSETQVSEQLLAKGVEPLGGCRARLEWREEMDRGIRRLLTDADLMLDKSLDQGKHAMRCDHLDKTFAWFEQHGKKEVSKERAAPAYIRFEEDDPIMAGSLRKQDPCGPKGWMPSKKSTTTAAPPSVAPVSPLVAAAQQALGVGSPPASTPTAASSSASDREYGGAASEYTKALRRHFGPSRSAPPKWKEPGYS